MNQSNLNLDDLRKRVDGLVIEPGSVEYAALAKLNNARFDHIQPQGVVLCSTPTDVAATVGFLPSPRLETATPCRGPFSAVRSATPGLPVDASGINTCSTSNGLRRSRGGPRAGAGYAAP